MTEKTKFLAEQAAKLPPTDRVELVEYILATLTETDPDWDAAWARSRRSSGDRPASAGC